MTRTICSQLSLIAALAVLVSGCGKLEQTAIAGDYPEVRVTVIGLAGSTRPALRDRFLEWCRRGESLAAFTEHRYRRSTATDAKPAK